MWVRCSKCQKRARLTPAQLANPKRCKAYGCKSTSYYVDHYRQHVERNGGKKATVCRCLSYHFPHRRESGRCEWRPPF